MYRKSRHFSYDVKCLTVFERFAYADAGKPVGTGAAQAQLNRLARIYGYSPHTVQGLALDLKNLPCRTRLAPRRFHAPCVTRDAPRMVCRSARHAYAVLFVD